MIEVRIPWGMLHLLTDPSSRTVLHGNPATKKVAGAATDGFRFVVQSFNPSDARQRGDVFPRPSGSATFGDPPLWTWPTWEVPRWYAETKPLFGEMQRAFAGIPDHRPARLAQSKSGSGGRD